MLGSIMALDVPTYTHTTPDKTTTTRDALAGPVTGLQGARGGTTQKAAIPVGYGPLSELVSTLARRQDANRNLPGPARDPEPVRFQSLAFLRLL